VLSALLRVLFWVLLCAGPLLLWGALRPDRRLLDPRDAAAGPQAADAALTIAVAATERVGVGPGWAAAQDGLGVWHTIDTADLGLVAVVPPSAGHEFLRMRGWLARGPYLVLRGITGHVLKIDVHNMNPELRRALAEQLPAASVVTPTAAEFLTSGGLPGRWDRRYQFSGFRFGYSRRPPAHVATTPAPTDPDHVWAPPPGAV